MQNQKLLLRKQLQQTLTRYKEIAALTRPPQGWIKTLRQALGMTTTQLAKRLEVDQSRISHLEQAEKEERVNLKTLQQVAEALNCQFVYAFIPKKPLDSLLKEQAKMAAAKTLQHVNHTMALEDQAVAKERLEEQVEELADEWVRQSSKRIWD